MSRRKYGNTYCAHTDLNSKMINAMKSSQNILKMLFKWNKRTVIAEKEEC